MSCAIKKAHSDGKYESLKTGQKTKPQRKLVSVICRCGAEKEISNTNYRASLRKHGEYLCMSCAIKKAHSDGKYKNPKS